MPAFSMAAPTSQPIRANSRKMEVQRAFEKKLEELEAEQDQFQQQLDRDEAKAMEILEQFLPLPDGLEQAVITATQQRDYISAECERYRNLLSRVQGAKDIVLSPEDEQLLEQALAYDDDAEVLDGNTAAEEEALSIGAAEAKEAQKNEEHMAKARKYEWNSGLGSSNASSSMFEEDASNRVLSPREGVVSDTELEDVDDESEVSNSQIDDGLLVEDGEPRRKARSWSTGSHISVYRPPTPEEEPDLEGMRTSPGSASSSRTAVPPSGEDEDEDMMYQAISQDFTPAEAPEPRKLNLGTGLQRKSTSNAPADLPLFRSRTPPPADLDDDGFGGDPSEMSPLRQQEDPRAATLKELQLEEMSNASRASSELSNPLFVRESTPWLPPREMSPLHQQEDPHAATLEELQLEEMSNASRASPELSNPLFVRESAPWLPPSEMSPLHQQEDPRAATLEELQLEEISNASRASSELSNPLFVRESTPWLPPREQAKAPPAKGLSKQRRGSPAAAAHPPSGLPHTTWEHSRVDAYANLAQQPSLQAKTVVAPSISREKSPLTFGRASLSAPAPAEISSPTTDDFDLPFGNSSWNFDAVDAAQAEAAAHDSDQTALALRAKTQTRATPDSSTSAKTLKQTPPRRQVKPKKSVRFAHDFETEVLLYPTADGKSFQLIGQQAKGPLLATPEQAKGDWTFFKKMPSQLKRKAGDAEEDEKLEGTLGAYNRKKTKMMEAKKKSSSAVEEAGDVDDSEPDLEAPTKPAHMRGSSPKAGKKKASKKKKDVRTIEDNQLNVIEEKSTKAAAKSSKKEAAKPKGALEEKLKELIMQGPQTTVKSSKKEATKPKGALEEKLKKLIMQGPQTTVKRGSSGLFGPDQ
ncbi:hypothetical protein AC578_1988 [Pseudocercospora eumusae]|uniref:Uncharacterized protein n=1 Tax=Pseudocercospora eumusae TaxID=321146 RepID=A0A139HH31_9PEZI|nr:hypothetical protein AC578_1988 [Pseudocercospora eumusae]